MSRPELDHELEAIGRRLSPRLGPAHDAIVGRAAGGARLRRPRPALPGLRRLGGATLTLGATAAFAALLAVGVARPATPGPHGAPVALGPAVAMATSPGIPAATGTAGGVPGGVLTAPAADAVVAPAPGFVSLPTFPPVTAPSRPAGAITAPTAPAGQPTTAAAPEPTAPAPQPTAAATPAPSAAATPTEPPTAPPTPAPTPSRFAPTAPPAAGPARVVLTEKDSGRTITIHRGDVVEVDLSSPQDGSHWTEPQSTDPAVVSRGSGSTSSKGGARAVFTAAGDGSAQLQASRVPACATATPRCLPPQRIDFQVDIIVTG